MTYTKKISLKNCNKICGHEFARKHFKQNKGEFSYILTPLLHYMCYTFNYTHPEGIQRQTDPCDSLLDVEQPCLQLLDGQPDQHLSDLQ